MSSTGRPWREFKVVEKRLNPLLRMLGIKRKGLNGFRHFNATGMDSKNIPVKTRQTRPGHDDPKMTLGMKNKSSYTHMIGEDDRRVATMFGNMFSQVLCPDASKSGNAPAQVKQAFEFRGLQGHRENPVVRVEKFKSSLPDHLVLAYSELR